MTTPRTTKYLARLVREQCSSLAGAESAESRHKQAIGEYISVRANDVLDAQAGDSPA